ncbi:MAG: hypothetical protein ABSH53_16915 [Holophaga sp.]|jgi:hypothetical protein
MEGLGMPVLAVALALAGRALLAPPRSAHRRPLRPWACLLTGLCFYLGSSLLAILGHPGRLPALPLLRHLPPVLGWALLAGLLLVWAFGVEGPRLGKALMLTLLAGVLGLPAGRLRLAMRTHSRTATVQGLLLVLDTAREAGLNPLLPPAVQLARTPAG